MLKQFRLLSLVTNELIRNSKMSFYAVAKGRTEGIFSTWSECEGQVKGYVGAKYKKFSTYEDAESFVVKNGGTVKTKKNSPEPQTYWPEEYEDNDDELLISAVESQEIKTGSPTKRKASSSRDQSSGNGKKKKYESIIWKPVGITKYGSYDFPIDSEGYVIVYTDGACENNGQKGACAGFGVYFADNHPLNASEPVSGRATNNCGEIQAASHAIKVAKKQGIKKLCVSTDSQFLINAITSWIRSWKMKGWKLKSGGEVKNFVDFKELDDLLSDKTISVKWNYVKGHKGILGNEKADQLAKEGAQIYKRLHS